MENGLVRRSWYLGLLCLAVSNQAHCKSIEEWVEDVNSLFAVTKQSQSLADDDAQKAIFLSGLTQLLVNLDTNDAWQNVAVVEAIFLAVYQIIAKEKLEDAYNKLLEQPFDQPVNNGSGGKYNALRHILDKLLEDLSDDGSSSSSDSSSTSSDDSEASLDLASLTSIDASDDISDLVASLGGFEDAPAINLGETVDLMQAVNGRIQQIRAENFEDVSIVEAGEVYGALLDLQKVFKNHATNLAVVELMHQILVGASYESDLDSNIRNKIEDLKTYFDGETEYFARIVNTQARQYVPVEPPVPAVLQERPYQKGVQVQTYEPLVNRRPMAAPQVDDDIDVFGWDRFDEQ